MRGLGERVRKWIGKCWWLKVWRLNECAICFTHYYHCSSDWRSFFFHKRYFGKYLILHLSMQNSKSMVMVDSVDQWSIVCAILYITLTNKHICTQRERERERERERVWRKSLILSKVVFTVLDQKYRKSAILLQFKITVFYLNISYNVIYSCDAKLHFLTVFSVTWSFRKKHSNMLIWCPRNISYYYQ